MGRISAKQNYLMDQLREQGRRIEKLSKVEHDLIKEVHPQVGEINLIVMQADGNGSGAYMHSGMRGGPHVGALRRCSFTEAENYSKRNLRASPESPPAG